MSSQRNNIELSGIAPQRTGVPADHIDPNHPYFPHDFEAQLPPRPFYKRHSKKCFFITTGIVLIIGLIIASLLIGIRVGLAKRPLEPALAHETTTITSTSTRQAVYSTPDSVTRTTTLRTTVGNTAPTKTVPFEAPTRPTAMKPVQEICSEKGSWPTTEECRGNCEADGRLERATCVAWTGGYTCKTCSSAHA
jgi:hypothetical protein